MASDAHAHPADLRKQFPQAEDERRSLPNEGGGRGVPCAASTWNLRDFEYHEELAEQARNDGAPPLIPCFAVHPQLPAVERRADWRLATARESLDTLFALAEAGRLRAVGETGFDLYDAAFRETEVIQDELFASHLEIALQRGLPLVLHVRRAMHKVFAHTKALKRVPSVILHSFSGTLGEGESLLKRGVNAYFSFGAVIALNHKGAIRACAALPADRLLTETDAPYQPLRAAPFSRWADLPVILRAMVDLRREAGNFNGTAAELGTVIDGNWARAFLVG